MWMAAEDARSDFVLAAAGMILGTLLVRFVEAVPFYPDGILAVVMVPVWMLLLTVVIARFFVRYRDQGLAGYGLTGDRAGLSEGLVVAAPLLVAGYVRGLPAHGPVGALLGRIQPVTSAPVVETPSALEYSLRGTVLAIAIIGAVMMYGLLVTRARDGFRAVDLSLVQAVRSFGLGAVAVSTLLGLLLSVVGGSALNRLVDGIALGATVLLADRLVARNDRTSRATVLAPAIVALVGTILSSGGLFGGNLAVGLWRGTAAAAVTVVVTTLIETRRVPWAAVPVVAAAMWAPTCTTLPVGYLLIQPCA